MTWLEKWKNKDHLGFTTKKGETVEEKIEEVNEVGKFIGGEIRIVADPETGRIGVSAPQNFIIAFGLIEVGKTILMQMQRDEQVKAEKKAIPAIVKGTPEMMAAVKMASPLGK